MHKQAFRSPLLTVAVASVLAASAASGQENKRPEVELETSMGTILLELNPEKAPKTVENFLQYVKDGHYDGTVFHRVIPNFMIQGGGMKEDLSEKPTRSPVQNEAGNGLTNKKYTIAMARTPDPNSATSQFFINVVDNDYLNRDLARGEAGYTVFGRVVKGLDTVDEISKVKTRVASVGGQLMRDVPADPVFLKKARIVEESEK